MLPGFAPRPGGKPENSLTLQRWVSGRQAFKSRRDGWLSPFLGQVSRPFGTGHTWCLFPTLKRWPSVRCPSGTATARFQLLLSCLLLVGFTLIAGEVKIELPPETASFKPGSAAGLANGQCLTCHSVEYVVTQPLLPGSFWLAEVKKMRDKYGAAIPDDQVEVLADYLTENYGAAAAGHAQSAAAQTKTAPVPAKNESVEALATKYGCLSCHNVTRKIVGPPYQEVAAKYRSDPGALEKIKNQIHNGSVTKAGTPGIMPPFPMVSDEEAHKLAVWIMSQSGG